MENYKQININDIIDIPNEYLEEFKNFCEINNLKLPNITSGRGKALAVMINNPYKYWNRETCDAFCKKFKIITKDSIQLFNKHSQFGIQTNSGIEKGNLYIVYPYCLSNKHKMRKNFKYNGDENEKNIEIDKIKSTIKTDYIDVPNDKWQLGHKNPSFINDTSYNLILQPPIQSKYKDDYIFIDTLTKIPLPNKLLNMIKLNEIELTIEQIDKYIEIFNILKNNLLTS